MVSCLSNGLQVQPFRQCLTTLWNIAAKLLGKRTTSRSSQIWKNLPCMIPHAPHFQEFYVDFHTFPKKFCRLSPGESHAVKAFLHFRFLKLLPSRPWELSGRKKQQTSGPSPTHTWFNGCKWQSSQVLFSSLDRVMWESEDTIMIEAQTKMRGANDQRENEYNGLTPHDKKANHRQPKQSMTPVGQDFHQFVCYFLQCITNVTWNWKIWDRQHQHASCQAPLLYSFWQPVSRPTHLGISTLDPCVLPTWSFIGWTTEEDNRQVLVVFPGSPCRRMQLIHRKSTLNEQQSNPSARESRGEKKKKKEKRIRPMFA